MELHQFFLFLTIILIAACVLSETTARLGIPPVIGELVAGLLIDPSLLGWVSPDTTMKLPDNCRIGRGDEIGVRSNLLESAFLKTSTFS